MKSEISFFLLEQNCFMLLCQSLLYNIVNQPYVYICHLPLDAPSQPTPLSTPFRSSQSTQLSSLCYAVACHQLFYTGQCPPSFPPSPSYLANRFICTIFLDSIYVVLLLLSHVSLQPHGLYSIYMHSYMMIQQYFNVPCLRNLSSPQDYKDTVLFSSTSFIILVFTSYL